MRVQFRRPIGEWIRARDVLRSDASLDVAVVSVLVSSLGLSTPPTFPMNRLGDPASIKPGATVYTVGFPNGRPWGDAEASGRYTEKLLTTLRFRSDWVSPGHSGGGLFDEQWNLLGLLQRDEPPSGKALGVRDLLELLRAWGYQVQLVEGTSRRPPPTDTTQTPSKDTTPASDAWILTGDHAMVSFSVRNESAGDFRQHIASALRRLREGGAQGEGNLRSGYWLLEDVGSTATTVVPFVLLASPVQPGSDYSPQNLVARYVPDSAEPAAFVRQVVERRGAGTALRLIADFAQPGARVGSGGQAAHGGEPGEWQRPRVTERSSLSFASLQLPAARPNPTTPASNEPSQAKPQTPTNQPATAPLAGDPLTFNGSFGMIFDYVKSQEEPQFSSLMAQRHAMLQSAMGRLGQSRLSWKVYESVEPIRDARLYLTVILPVVRGFDYREAAIMGSSVTDRLPEFTRYRDLLVRRARRDFRVLVGPVRSR